MQATPADRDSQYPIQRDDEEKYFGMRNELVPSHWCEQVDDDRRIEIVEGVTPAVSMRVDYCVSESSSTPCHTLLEPCG